MNGTLCIFRRESDTAIDLRPLYPWQEDGPSEGTHEVFCSVAPEVKGTTVRGVVEREGSQGLWTQADHCSSPGCIGDVSRGTWAQRACPPVAAPQSPCLTAEMNGTSRTNVTQLTGT